MFFMIRSVIFLSGIVLATLGAILFVQRQEESSAYFVLTQQRSPSAFLSQQLRLPDGRIYRHLPPDFGLFAAWSPDSDMIFHQRTDGLYVYDTSQKRDHLVIETSAQSQLPLAPNHLWRMMYLSPDGTGYLFLGETSLYHFDTRGKNVREIFTSPNNGVYAMWEEDGQWVIFSYADRNRVLQRQRMNVRDPSQNEALGPGFQISTPFGLIEPNLPGWRIYPRDSEESIELQFPEPGFFIAEWLTDDLLLVARQIEVTMPRKLYLMDINSQELTEVVQSDDMGSIPNATLKGDNLYVYYERQPGYVLTEIPIDGGEPTLLLDNCTDVFFFDSKTQRTRRWQGEPVDTIFLVVNDEGRRSIHRYDFGERTTQRVYTTPGLASQPNVIVSPDNRSLVMSYQGLGSGTGYFHHLINVDVTDGSNYELARDHTLSAVSPLMDRTVNIEILATAGILLTGLGLYRRQ